MIFGASIATKMLKPRGRPKTGKAQTAISIQLPPETLAVASRRYWLAERYGGVLDRAL